MEGNNIIDSQTVNTGSKPKIGIYILIILFLAILGVTGYLGYSYLTESTKLARTVLVFNTTDLPDATNYNPYEQWLTATLVGANTDLAMTVTDLPEGLFMEECKNSNDSDYATAPNTTIRCKITGILSMKMRMKSYVRIVATVQTTDKRLSLQKTLGLFIDP